MPFERVDALGGFIGTPDVPDPDEVEDPGFMAETLPAAFRTENTIGSFFASEAKGFSNDTIDPELKVFSEIEGTQYEQFADQFAEVRTREHLEAVKMDVDREVADRETIAQAGGPGMVAAMGAGFFDLPTLLPGTVALRTAKGGVSVLRTAGRTAIAGAVEAGVSEVALQATQQTRTAAETSINIAGSAVLAGILGAGVGALLKRSDTASLAKRVEKDFTVPGDTETDPFVPGFMQAPLSAGAAGVEQVDNTLKSALGAEKAFRFQDPLLRMQTSAAQKSREHIQELAETPLVYTKSAEGLETAPLGSQLGAPGSVESRIKAVWQFSLADTVAFVDDSFVGYRLGRAKRFGDVARTATRDKLAGAGDDLTYTQFKEAVAKAARRNGEHEIPQVAEAAKRVRKYYDDGLARIQEAGLLADDIAPETALSYVNRVYNREKIIRERPAFKERVSSWLRKERDEADPDSERAARGDAEIDSLSDEIVDRILGTPDGRLPYDAHLSDTRTGGARANARGPLAARLFNIPDDLIEDFLENDIEHLLRVYTRSVAPDVEIAKRFGDVDMTVPMKEILDEYNALAGKAKTAKERAKLQKQKDADIRDLAAVRDRIRGTYAMPTDPEGMITRTAAVVRSANYLRLLGGMTLSAVPDMSRLVMAHGFTRTFQDGLAPLFRNPALARMAAGEVKMAGTALDMVLDSRAMQLADVMDDFGRLSKFERGVQAASRNFGVVSLMAPWNAAMKQLSGTVTMTQILRAAERVGSGKASKKEIELLASGGISEGNARKIAEQFSKHGKKQDGVFFANTREWDKGARPAVEAFRVAVARDVDRTIVTPGQDKPLFMSRDMGRLIFQFKSFAVASMQRTLISGLQQRDMGVLNGALMAVALGGLVHIVKQQQAGRPVETDFSDPEQFTQFMVNAVDRSGLTGWLMDANSMTEKLTRGAVGLSAVTGKPVSRYANRNLAASFIGPTAGTITDFALATGSLASGDVNQSDIRAMRRLLPYQNLFYLRQIFDQAEAGISEFTGAK